jgi:hypothetical protein
MPSSSTGPSASAPRKAEEVIARETKEFYGVLAPIVSELHAQDLSLRDIALELVLRGIKARRGSTAWSAAQVRRILRWANGKAVGPAAEPPSAAGMKQEPAAPSALEKPSIRLMINGTAHGPFSISQVQAMLDTGEITLDTQYLMPGLLNCRRVRDLFAPNRPAQCFNPATAPS